MAEHQNTLGRISDRVVKLCTSTETVSSLLAREPGLAPADAWERLYGQHALKAAARDDAEDEDAATPEPGPVEADALQTAASCGKWGPTQPSELFLQIYHDALCTLNDSPVPAMVSLPLMGSCGVMPLTIISVVPDIVRHMSNVIVRAEREVFLATNYWQDSVASKFLTDAIRELDRRAGERGSRVVVKVLYDRGSPKQLIEPHYIVSEKAFTGKNVKLPQPCEIQNIDMEVMNYHTPLLGTFHSKYMVVDRKIALLQSNNIQDNDNLEMLVHLEGPIVDSLYDMALISWHKKLDPPLPSANSPAAQGGLGSWPSEESNGSAVKGGSRHENGRVREPGVVDPSVPAASSDTTRADTLTGPSTTEGGTHPHPTQPQPTGAEATGGDEQKSSLRSQAPNGAADKQAETYLAKGEQSIPQNQMQEPTPPDSPLPEHDSEDPHYDVDIAGEVARVQTAVSPKPHETRMQAVTRLLNHTVNKGFEGDAPKSPPGEEMTPYIAHPAHEPFPMALVNRAPYGPPTHKSVSNPQNAAWISGLRHAKKSVFIQSPTLNAEPVLPAIREACERGVDVYCYICLGYNDAGELLPKQGGHNEMVAHKLYESLSAAARQRLHYFWYVAKDMTRPLVQEHKKRSCHIKLMIVDERVGIQGNGNQDTQSWFHSQEINVMLDSAAVCRAWTDALRRNQNTHIYGALDQEQGLWLDGDGNEAEGVIGVDPGRFSWARGVVGAIKRVQGTGGF
ncbi:hypothetical protein B0T26DRAFT_673406 [Lasiosphaeria miniovina]|uniref:PLD phosphodiesterase domain-containing protein n=1 Tax=Lasiosphaeria miniovina TaxID=1954250 RepID=A0AA40ATC2_9PEZI|nr:uncharacterized protein B0T26DRAFT_673406 [Lasiosphaeria miniovina]KAK0721602.1 hypothetical protein B0T26DRAFT_673406 [Lasiosphaeria miniovina]